MDCERADLLVGLLGAEDDPADDALTPAERVEAEAHVAGCATCREALAAYRDLAGALRTLPAAADELPSPEAAERAYAAVLEAMRADAAAAASRPGAGGLRVLEGGRAADAREGRRAHRRPAAWLQGLAAAACLLIVATLAFFRADDPSARLSRAPQAPALDQAAGSAPARAETDDEPEGRAAPADRRAPPLPDLRGPGADGLAAEALSAEAEPPEMKLEAAKAAGAQAPAAEGLREAAAEPAPPAPPAAPPPPPSAVPMAEADDVDVPRVATARDEEAPSVVAAWRVGDRLVVLERSDDGIVAREGALRADGEPARMRPATQARAAAPPGATAGAPAGPVAVTPVDPAQVEPVRGRTPPDLERELLAILAAELERPRDPARTSRVALVLDALDVAVTLGADPEEVEALARRVLAAPPAAAPAGR